MTENKPLVHIPPPPVLPGWSRRLRAAAMIPALVAPAIMTAAGVYGFIDGARYYYSLPMTQRLEDGDPFSPDAGMYFGAFIVFCGLLTLVPAVLAVLPRRLSLALAVVAFGVGMLPVMVFAGGMVERDALGALGVAYAYVPGLVVVRRYLQNRIDRRGLIEAWGAL
jgi:hypothetical protein